MISLQGQYGLYTFDEQQQPLSPGKKFNFTYKGRDDLQREVLIKQLLPSLASEPVSVKRFRNEFDHRVTHPCILSATDYFIHEGDHYIVRNWVEGKDLTAILHRLSLQQSLSICSSVLQALSQLHAHHILHLDVQPKNIIIGNDGRVYLTDLGLSRKMNESGYRQPFNIYYSAPEQIINLQQLVNESTDLFAVGMILLEMLTRTKFQAHENPEILMNLVLASPLTNTGKIDEGLFRIIKKAAEKPRFNLPPGHYSFEELYKLIVASQLSRYRYADEFGKDLEQWLTDHPGIKPWWKFW